jgi:hypothetical protein
MERQAGAKKDFENKSRVSSLLQVCPSLILNCGIRVERGEFPFLAVDFFALIVSRL